MNNSFFAPSEPLGHTKYIIISRLGVHRIGFQIRPPLRMKISEIFHHARYPCGCPLQLVPTGYTLPAVQRFDDGRAISRISPEE